jgi:hypothetical protein
MYGSNSGDLSQQAQRFIDGNDEPLLMMTPIKGYDKMPLVSVEEAVKPLISIVRDVQQMADIAKQRSRKAPPSHLSIDQSAAITLYTLEWDPREDSVYYVLNKSLRTENRQILRPWFLYLKLFFSALALLPSTTRTVYRGVRGDQKNRYKKGEKIVWWGFSSCTGTMDILNNHAFMGVSGARTLFAIECQNGKDIRQHSYFKSEDEFLLPAARELQVKSVVPQADGLTLIQLEETQPKYPLLESFSSISQLVQSFPPSNPIPIQTQSAVHSLSNTPVIQQPIQKSQSNI